MANNSTYGYQSRFSFGASPATFSGSSQRFELVSSTVKLQGELLNTEGLLGTRTKRVERCRFGLKKVGGQIAVDLTPRMLDFFLPYILGATESTDTFAVADVLPGFDMLHDPFGTGSEAIKYSELYVDKFSLKFGPGILRATMDVIGKTATPAQAYAGAALGSTNGADNPYVFYDTASGWNLNNADNTDEIIEGELTIDNGLDPEFRNNQTASSIRASDRTVSLSTNLPLTAANMDLYYDTNTTYNATIVIDNGTVASTITLYNLKHPLEGPEAQGKKEQPLMMKHVAYGDASNPDILFTVTGASL